eukprot:8964554-Ditylum_brightwellii.AAC.1
MVLEGSVKSAGYHGAIVPFPLVQIMIFVVFIISILLSIFCKDLFYYFAVIFLHDPIAFFIQTNVSIVHHTN